jgi:hypothetical protein
VTGVLLPFTSGYNDNLLYMQGDVGTVPPLPFLDGNGLGLTFDSLPFVLGLINSSSSTRAAHAVVYLFNYYLLNYTESLPSSNFDRGVVTSVTVLPYAEGDAVPDCQLPAVAPPPPQVLETTELCSVRLSDFWAAYVSVNLTLLSPDPALPISPNQLVLNATGWRYFIDTSQVPTYTENLTITGVAAVGSLDGNDNLLCDGRYAAPVDAAGLVFTFDSVPTVYDSTPIEGAAPTPYAPQPLLRLFTSLNYYDLYESNSAGWSEAYTGYVDLTTDLSGYYAYCPTQPPQPFYPAPFSHWTMCATFEGESYASATFAYINATDTSSATAFDALEASGWRDYALF